jgi:putative FmdB family regulatory protein
MLFSETSLSNLFPLRIAPYCVSPSTENCYNQSFTQRNQRMPIYEYICDNCKSQFEKIVINREQEISCPQCSSKKATIQLSVFSSAIAGGSTKSSSGSSSGGSCCGGGCGCH